jgi:predicted hydrocarbon binding protein
MTQIRGFAIRGLLHYAKSKGLSPTHLVAELPEPARSVFARQIFHSELYPYEGFVELVHLLERRLGAPFGTDADTFAREVGRAAALEDIKGIFQVAVLLTSPEKAVHRGQNYWSRYCDTGTMVEEEVRPGYSRTALEGFPHIDRLHCKLIEGWHEAGIGSTWGAKNVQVTQLECVHKGGKRCVFEGHWD